MVPKQFTALYRVFYFIIFIIVLNFFITNLFVGVVVSQYNKQKEMQGDNFMLTKN